MIYSPKSTIETPATFALATASQTIVKWAVASCRERSSVSADVPQATMAMQRLVAMIASLQQGLPSHIDPLQGEPADHSTLTVNNLLPYVSEEAYDVLDALQSEQEAVLNGVSVAQTIETPGTQSSDLASELISIANLVPRLLWAVMRSSYSIMRLIEGVEVEQYEADRGWVTGMLRLVVLLEMQSPGLNGCFDLATGRQPEVLLAPDCRLRAEEPILPLPRSPLAFVVGSSAESAVTAEQQLQALKQQIKSANPDLSPLFTGVPLECLYPGQDWQIGQLQCHLGFEFVAQESTSPHPSFLKPDLVEAELLEDGMANVSGHAAAGYSITHVAVIELPRQSFNAALVRLKESSNLVDNRQNVTPSIVEAIKYLNQAGTGIDVDSNLYAIVQTACTVADAVNQVVFPLQVQPTLLTDELLPRLLWHMTRSSYTMMQLMGGIEANTLQPSKDWQQGTLRVLASLHIQTAITDYRIDLASGQPIRSEDSLLSPDTVCQQTPVLGMAMMAQTIPSLQQPILVQTLLGQLQGELQTTLPEILLQPEGITIEWLETDQDWQPATMRFSLNLEFIPAATN